MYREFDLQKMILQFILLDEQFFLELLTFSAVYLMYIPGTVYLKSIHYYKNGKHVVAFSVRSLVKTFSENSWYNHQQSIAQQKL